MKIYWNLINSFFQTGMLGFGGGPASIPLIQKEVVNKYKWMDQDEFGDILAIANSLPGPIATKLAGYIGYRIAGWTGMLLAIIAHIFPTILVLIMLLVSLSSFREFSWVQGMTAAVIPVVGMMMTMLTWSFIKKSASGFGWGKAVLFGGILFILLQFLGIHPALIIATLLILALSIGDKDKNKEKKESGNKKERNTS
jgi:chromate transporter